MGLEPTTFPLATRHKSQLLLNSFFLLQVNGLNILITVPLIINDTKVIRTNQDSCGSTGTENESNITL